jgi:hypothetical protein
MSEREEANLDMPKKTIPTRVWLLGFFGTSLRQLIYFFDKKAEEAKALSCIHELNRTRRSQEDNPPVRDCLLRAQKGGPQAANHVRNADRSRELWQTLLRLLS